MNHAALINMVAGLLTAITYGLSAQAQPLAPAGETFKVVTVVEGLRNPWSMAWLPNGDMLVTERGGSLRIVRDGKLLPDPVPGVPPVRALGQGGMQDVAVHPDFARNHFIYLSYAKPRNENKEGTTALMRAKFEDDRLVDAQEIFEAKAWNERPGHFGARLAFDREGYLFLSVGDRMAGSNGPNGVDPTNHPAQDLMSHQGKILRLRDDGTVPSDNPFVGRRDALPEIWSWGHRNPQGLAVNPETNQLWSTEHGPQGGDELNAIHKGANYGWPVIGYGVNYFIGTEIHQSRTREGMEQPQAYWVPSIGISGLLFYTGDKFPNWKGNALIGGLSAQWRQLVRVSLRDVTVLNREPLLLGQYRIRDVRQGPDGFVYIATDNAASGRPSAIIRLEPST